MIKYDTSTFHNLISACTRFGFILFCKFNYSFCGGVVHTTFLCIVFDLKNYYNAIFGQLPQTGFRLTKQINIAAISQ